MTFTEQGIWAEGRCRGAGVGEERGGTLTWSHFFFFLLFLATLRAMRDLSFPSRD